MLRWTWRKQRPRKLQNCGHALVSLQYNCYSCQTEYVEAEQAQMIIRPRGVPPPEPTDMNPGTAYRWDFISRHIRGHVDRLSADGGKCGYRAQMQQHLSASDARRDRLAREDEEDAPSQATASSEDEEDAPSQARASAKARGTARRWRRDMSDGSDYVFVCKSALENLKEKLENGDRIPSEEVFNLLYNKFMKDDEVLVPVDMRYEARDFKDFEEMFGANTPELLAEAFHRAQLLYKSNPDGLPDEERPPGELTVSAFKTLKTLCELRGRSVSDEYDDCSQDAEESMNEEMENLFRDLRVFIVAQEDRRYYMNRLQETLCDFRFEQAVSSRAWTAVPHRARSEGKE